MQTLFSWDPFVVEDSSECQLDGRHFELKLFVFCHVSGTRPQKRRPSGCGQISARMVSECDVSAVVFNCKETLLWRDGHNRAVLLFAQINANPFVCQVFGTGCQQSVLSSVKVLELKECFRSPGVGGVHLNLFGTFCTTVWRAVGLALSNDKNN